MGFTISANDYRKTFYIFIRSIWENMSFLFSIHLTFRVDVWVLVCSGAGTEQRLRADAAQIHIIDIQHHAGHHSLVEQSRTSYLKKIWRWKTLLEFTVNLYKLFCSSVHVVPVPGVRTTSVSSGMKQSGVLWAVSWLQGILGGSPGRKRASAPSVWQSCGYLPADWWATIIKVSYNMKY